MFSERLKQIRKQKGLTQKELAEKSGILQCQISMFEHDTSQPSIFSLVCLCAALGVTATELLGF